jgi:hypothetical protein
MRSQATPARQANNPAKPAGLAQTPVRLQSITFQYVGRTALTAVGPVSGRHYRFSQTGAMIEVDFRDRGALATVPNLRQIGSS